MIKGIQKLHLQGSELGMYSVIKPPAIGPTTGPRKAAMVNRPIGGPSSFAVHIRLASSFHLPKYFKKKLHKRFQISVMVPAATVNAGEPKVPTSNLQMTKVSIFFASAHPIWKITNSAHVGI